LDLHLIQTAGFDHVAPPYSAVKASMVHSTMVWSPV